MILFYNVFITNSLPVNQAGSKILPVKNRGNLRSSDNLDILKYSLASVSKIHNWSQVILFIKLDDEYHSRQEELTKFIHSEFKNQSLILRFTRNEYQNDWIETFNLFDPKDRLIWFCCNHDHIFIDYDIEYLNKLVDLMYKEEKYCSLIFSHWQENIRNIKFGMDARYRGGGFNPLQLPREYKIEEFYLSNRGNIIDSIQIITKELYINWWFVGKFWASFIPRPDYFNISLAHKEEPLAWQKVIIPLRELCRHFDGYSHVGIGNNQCPSLEIPLGFFENDIKIKLGFPVDRKYTNFNPCNPHYFAYNELGTDYKFLQEDIPFFWKNRISNIETNPSMDVNMNVEMRFKSIVESLFYEAFPVDTEVMLKIINLYIGKYGDFRVK